MNSCISFLICLFTLNSVYAQTLSLTGKVINKSSSPVSEVSVIINHGAYKTKTDKDGHFSLKLPANNYDIIFKHINYEAKSMKLNLTDNKNIDVELHQHKKRSIDEVTISEKIGIKKVKESAYNVTVLDAKPTYNTSTELTTLLNKASGVKIRQEAGLGSDYNIAINGFTGRSVKIFMDGVPMDGFGSAYNLNNIPTTLVDRIEIYKGVVPIEFGGDAMGGVINIVSRKLNRIYVDASYSMGSFNTHKSNINFGFVNKNGFTLDLRAIQNYSDNSYRVFTKNLDLNTETFSEDKAWYKRFHDKYHNESLVAKIGYVNVPWADQFFIGATIGQEYKDIQNAYDQKIVYGQRHNSSKTVMPNLTYVKRNFLINKLDLNFNANYNLNTNNNVDTASRRYNWLGEYKTTKQVGEGSSTLSTFKNKNASLTGNIKYQLANHHNFNVNNTFTTFSRKQNNKFAEDAETAARNAMRSVSNKNILGIAYQYDSKKNWNASAFYKLYTQFVVGAVDTSTNSSTVKLAEQNRLVNNSGYGALATYFYDKFQFKLSYEKAFRLLSSNELFGDETLETANTSLRPEKSNNLNFNVAYTNTFNQKHDFYVEAGFIYRNTYDYIRRVVDARYGTISSVNHGKVLAMGVDAEAKYVYKNKLIVGATATYLKTKNLQKYATANSTQVSTYYEDQLPNTPYLYGNMDVQYNIHNIIGKNNHLTMGYNMNYVHEFYLGWPSLGKTKLTLPDQFSHDIFITAALARGKYNITVESRNITNELLYDNFELQKPGRSFSVKLRYFLNKVHQ